MGVFSLQTCDKNRVKIKNPPTSGYKVAIKPYFSARIYSQQEF